MDKENFFNHNNGLCFPADFPYDFASPSSTESESDDDDDVSVLTRSFSRSASVQHPFCNIKEKRVFSGSPESTLGWSVSGRPQAPSPPPFVKGDEDAWNLIYAAAGEVARMKMKMRINMNMNNGNTRNRVLLGAPSSFAHCSRWGSDGEEFFRQQQFSQNVGCGCGCGARPPSFHHSPWPAPQVQNQRLQQHRPNQHKPCNVPVIKPVVLGGSSGGCDGGGGAAAAAKRECAGTGVFLPRRYCNNPPESRKRHAHLTARMAQPSNKNVDSITAQANINGGVVPHYEMLMGRRNAMILAAQQRRSSIHGGTMEAPVNNPEMLLPQEWTY